MNPEEQADDELLVLRCQEGDGAAFDVLLQRWQERLWRHALRRTGDEAAAWDILQEACLAIARDIPKLETAAAFGVWAYRITEYKSRDWIRQHVRRRQREAAYAEQWLLDQAGEPELPGGLEKLREMLPRLGEADRVLLSLRFEDGFSIDDISEMLAVPSGTAKSRLHHAKQRLRQLMEIKP